MTGKKITSEDGTLSNVYNRTLISWSNRRGVYGSKEGVRLVKLSKGLPGVYLPYDCGAFCGDGKVVWDQNGYRYSVGGKGSSLKFMVDMANSAIENQP